MNALAKIGALLRVVVPCFCFERRRALAKDRLRPQLRLGCFCRGQHLAYVANGGSLFHPLDAVAAAAKLFFQKSGKKRVRKAGKCGILIRKQLQRSRGAPMKIPARGFTHAGKFHADDVFATALLQILRPDIKVTRGFVVPDGFDGIVYDIGDGMFDHHREPRETRANGVPYAAFGLLWRMLGPGLVGERQARLIDENFIQPLDLNDNTGEQNSLCDAIGFFNPTWDSPDSSDDRFFEAVAVAKQILTRQIESANAVNRADEKVRAAYAASKDGIVVLPCYLPWKNGLYKTDALFVVYPSQRGGWSAQCVTDHRTKKPKLPFPASWAGQTQDVIEARSGLDGISFCHASRFLITAKDKQTAVAACRLVLKNNGRA